MTRPTGIIRTLPYFGSDETKEDNYARAQAYRRMIANFKAIEAGTLETCMIAFSQKPTQEVLHCYLLVGGKIRVRANISHWTDGAEIGEVRTWDGSKVRAKFWAFLTAPVSWPPESVVRRGFQGFRYTEELW